MQTCMVTSLQCSRPDESVREAQLADPMIGPILRAREAGTPLIPELINASNHHTRQLLQQWEQLVVRDGVLYRTFESTDGASYRLQMVIPTQLQVQVLREIHGGRLSGHLGEVKMLHKIREWFYWPGMSRSVRDWCWTCPSCAALKGPSQKRHAPLQNLKVGYPLEVIAMDIVGPLPPGKSGNKYILVVSDYLRDGLKHLAFQVRMQ